MFYLSSCFFLQFPVFRCVSDVEHDVMKQTERQTCQDLRYFGYVWAQKRPVTLGSGYLLCVGEGPWQSIGTWWPGNENRLHRLITRCAFKEMRNKMHLPARWPWWRSCDHHTVWVLDMSVKYHWCWYTVYLKPLVVFVLNDEWKSLVYLLPASRSLYLTPS